MKKLIAISSATVALGIASLLTASAQTSPESAPAGLKSSSAISASPESDSVPEPPPHRGGGGQVFGGSGNGQPNDFGNILAQAGNFMRKMERDDEDARLLGEMNQGQRATLVARISKPDSEQENLEEDLTVMHRILEKAIGRNSEDEHHRAMGIQLFALGQSRAPRSLYIEAYGAVFLLDTPIPLLPPSEKMDHPKPKESDSTWEEAREEIYGDDQAHKVTSRRRFGDDPAGEPYDAAKVDELKDSILKALANANNIRGMRDERIMVVISNRAPENAKDRFRVTTGEVSGFGGGGMVGFGQPYAVHSRTRAKGSSEKSEAGKMTILVKKSDVEALAKKSLEFEEFKKRAAINIY